MSAPMFEYTQDVCDAWQVHHLCNQFADQGWDFLAMRGLPENVVDKAMLAPTMVLFRRLAIAEEGS